MRPAALIPVAAVAALLVVTACSSDDDCDAAAGCANKTDKIITNGKTVPLCGVSSTANGAQYSWKTDQGTCTCTLDQSLAGSFMRNCTFK